MAAMSRVRLEPSRSVLLVVDMQPTLLKTIHEAGRVGERVEFLAHVARLMDVPVLATEQNPGRMGGTLEALVPHIFSSFDKMAFSAMGCDRLREALTALERPQVVVVGVETHICVSLTANGLLESGYEVVVCPDAVSARTVDRHKLGMERIRDAGAVPAHTEAVAYEWLGTADHPRFRDVLGLVKALL